MRRVFARSTYECVGRNLKWDKIHSESLSRYLYKKSSLKIYIKILLSGILFMVPLKKYVFFSFHILIFHIWYIDRINSLKYWPLLKYFMSESRFIDEENCLRGLNNRDKYKEDFTSQFLLLNRIEDKNNWFSNLKLFF